MVSVNPRSTHAYGEVKKKNKKGERSINNPYRADLWLTNELPSHPSELSVPYIIGDILGSPDRCGYARSCSRFPIILRYLSGRFLRRDASRSSLTFSFDASRAYGREGINKNVSRLHPHRCNSPPLFLYFVPSLLPLSNPFVCLSLTCTCSPTTRTFSTATRRDSKKFPIRWQRVQITRMPVMKCK